MSPLYFQSDQLTAEGHIMWSHVEKDIDWQAWPGGGGGLGREYEWAETTLRKKKNLFPKAGISDWINICKKNKFNFPHVLSFCYQLHVWIQQAHRPLTGPGQGHLFALSIDCNNVWQPPQNRDESRISCHRHPSSSGGSWISHGDASALKVAASNYHLSYFPKINMKMQEIGYSFLTSPLWICQDLPSNETVSQASSQSCRSVDADAWCKRALTCYITLTLPNILKLVSVRQSLVLFYIRVTFWQELGIRMKNTFRLRCFQSYHTEYRMMETNVRLTFQPNTRNTT